MMNAVSDMAPVARRQHPRAVDAVAGHFVEGGEIGVRIFSSANSRAMKARHLELAAASALGSPSKRRIASRICGGGVDHGAQSVAADDTVGSI